MSTIIGDLPNGPPHFRVDMLWEWVFPTTYLHRNEEGHWEGCSFHDDRKIIIVAVFLVGYVWQYDATYVATAPSKATYFLH